MGRVTFQIAGRTRFVILLWDQKELAKTMETLRASQFDVIAVFSVVAKGGMRTQAFT
jgi:hypothetical protein